MIAGLGAACGLVTRNLDTYSRHMRTVRDFLVDQLIRNFSLVTADKANTRLGLGEVCWRYLDPLCLPNTLSLRIGGFTGPELLARVGHALEASTKLVRTIFQCNSCWMLELNMLMGEM